MRTVLGLNHEQQHQELLLTDIKASFAYNPLRPVYKTLKPAPSVDCGPMQWLEFSGGIKTIGHDNKGFCYDNEQPAHQVFLNDFRLASRPVSNGEYMDFIEAGAYQQADLWLSDAWAIIGQQNWQSPLYWQRLNGEWWQMTLAGLQRLDLQAPVSHISFYEANAYAGWVGKRLPAEAEWEFAAADLPIKGNLYNAGYLQSVAMAQMAASPVINQMFGDVWEWTQSPYSPYPGYHQAHGPLGEYNGKFMSSQMVLRGGSCFTADDHIRASYRNFFYPHERWQCSGVRLAEDIL